MERKKVENITFKERERERKLAVFNSETILAQSVSGFVDNESERRDKISFARDKHRLSMLLEFIDLQCFNVSMYSII